MNKQFSPQDLPKSHVMKERRMGGGRVNYNFRSRIEWHPVGWRLNKKAIARQFRKLHHLACHSPEPISTKWKTAYDVFYKKHFGTDKCSMRYANTYTCHSWL